MTWRLVIAALLSALLAACGGGSSGDSSTPAPPTAQEGTLALAVAGGAHPGVDHVWVTVKQVALHADAAQAWSSTDTSWRVLRLSTPLTIDLASLTNGATSALLAGANVAVGSYAQMRVFVLAHDAKLDDAAKNAGLLYNAQVDTADANGAAQHLPLEFADVSQGLRLEGPFVIEANASADLALQWDLERSLVRFADGSGIDRFTMRPDLRWYDLQRTGAIFGVVDKTLFCTGASRSACIYDVTASAQVLSADGKTLQSVRCAPVFADTSYALFGLFPLPALPVGATFEVVLRGRNMKTMVIRHVPIDVKDLLATTPTELGIDPSTTNHAPAPIVPELAAESPATLNAPMQATGARLVFGQTLPGESAALEVNGANVDPFTGLLAQPVPLPGGTLRVAEYSSSAPLVFGDVAPQEGANAFGVFARGTRYEDAAGPALVAGGMAFAAPEPSLKSGVAQGMLTVNLGGGSMQRTDAAELVVADVNGAVLARDVSALIGTSGQSVSVTLPAGSAVAALGGTAVYSVAVRTWKRGAAADALWTRAASTVDLRTAASASVTLTLP